MHLFVFGYRIVWIAHSEVVVGPSDFEITVFNLPSRVGVIVLMPSRCPVLIDRKVIANQCE